MTQVNEFLSDWRRDFGEVPPINYVLKWRLPERWVRFHSLPKSKRYAENPNEWATLIDRHFAVLDAVVDREKPFYLIANDYQSQEWKLIWNNAEFIDNFSNGSGDNDDLPVATYLCPKASGTDDFIKIFKLIAEDKLRVFLVQNKRIFAPYDGGIDIILETPEAAKSLKSKHPGWLSSEPSGL